jgi:hypothetical protein
MGSRLKLVAFAAVLACEPATQSAGGDGGSPLALIGELASSDPAVGASLERARRATPSDPLALGEASSHLSRPVGPSLRMKLGSRSEDATLVRLGADELAFTRTGVAATSARVEGAVVAYDAPTGPDVVTFPLGSSIEELFVLRAEGDRVGYDLSLPPGWAPRASDGRRVVLGDGEGDRIAIEAPRAWQLDGSPVELAVELRGLHLDFEVLGEPTSPVVIDPIWSPAVQPIKLRKNHTATLLGDGRVLLVGGTLVDTSDTSTELFDTAAGASELGPALATARAQHTATLLRDGRVLVAGGNDSSPGTELASVELFDPAVGTLEAGPDMAVPRAGHSATLLDDGRVLFVGGGSAELFDPSTTTFTQVGPVAVGGPSAALLSDGRVFILGVDTSGAVAFLFDPAVDTLTPIPPPASVDYDPGSASLTVLRDGRVVIHGACPCFSIGGPIFSDDRVFVWNPVTSTYSVAGSLQDGRIGHTANLLPDGRVIFLGGSYSSSADLFDPQAGTFTRIADALLQQRETHTSTVLPNGNVLVVGGDQASAELFHGGAPLSTNAFVPGPALGTGRRDHTATTLSDGRVLLAGGDLGPTPTPSDSELFDESLGSFASGAAMVQPRARHSATRLNDGRVLVVGGRADFTTILAAVEWFDATSETFVAGPSLATARIEHTATRLRDGRVLVAGGFDGTTELDSAELFDPVTNTFAPVGPLPLPLSGHRAILLRSGKVLLLGVGVAVLFDPEAETFALASAPGAARTGATLTTLAIGWGHARNRAVRSADGDLQLLAGGLDRALRRRPRTPADGGGGADRWLLLRGLHPCLVERGRDLGSGDRTDGRPLRSYRAAVPVALPQRESAPKRQLARRGRLPVCRSLQRFSSHRVLSLRVPEASDRPGAHRRAPGDRAGRPGRAPGAPLSGRAGELGSNERLAEQPPALHLAAARRRRDAGRANDRLRRHERDVGSSCHHVHRSRVAPGRGERHRERRQGRRDPPCRARCGLRVRRRVRDWLLRRRRLL